MSADFAWFDVNFEKQNFYLPFDRIYAAFEFVHHADDHNLVHWTCWTSADLVTSWCGVSLVGKGELKAEGLSSGGRGDLMVIWWPLCNENFNFFVKMKGMWAEPAAVQLTWWLGDLVHLVTPLLLDKPHAKRKHPDKSFF